MMPAPQPPRLQIWTTETRPPKTINLTPDRLQVLLLIAGSIRGLTDEEIHLSVPTAPRSTINSRRHSLVQIGLVRDSGQKRRISTGRSAIIWELTPKGRQVARRKHAATPPKTKKGKP